MKMTGFQLMYRLRELQDTRDIAGTQFDDCLYQFQADAGQKPSPVELTRVYRECERKIAALQVAQAQCNLAVSVEVLGDTMTLHEAVKLVGGAGRIAKMWKDAAKKGAQSHYGYGEPSRDKDHEYARRTVSVRECLEHSTEASRWASALRQAVQLGNAAEIEIEDLDADLFS